MFLPCAFALRFALGYHVSVQLYREVIMRGKDRCLIVAILAISLCLVGCSRGLDLTYVANGGTYSQNDLEPLLEKASMEEFAEVMAADAPSLRVKLLAQLRQQGDDAAALADTLTSEFPVDAAAVPVMVESATYEGKQVWIVIEAWGDEGGTLVHRRLWVFSADDLSVLAAQSRE